ELRLQPDAVKRFTWEGRRSKCLVVENEEFFLDPDRPRFALPEGVWNHAGRLERFSRFQKGGRRPGQAGGPPTLLPAGQAGDRLPEAGPLGERGHGRLSDWGVRLAPKRERHVLRFVLAVDCHRELVAGLLRTDYAPKLVGGFDRVAVGCGDDIPADEVALAVDDDLRGAAAQTGPSGWAARPHRLDQHTLTRGKTDVGRERLADRGHLDADVGVCDLAVLEQLGHDLPDGV